MQILTTSYEYPPVGGGGAKVAYGIATRLVARGHQVDLLTMGFRGLAATENVAGVAVRRVTKVRRRISTCSFVEMVPYVFLASSYLLKSVRAEKYAINHAHFIFPDGIIAYVLKRLRGLPYVITAHCYDVQNYNPHRFRI